MVSGMSDSAQVLEQLNVIADNAIANPEDTENVEVLGKKLIFLKARLQNLTPLQHIEYYNGCKTLGTIADDGNSTAKNYIHKLNTDSSLPEGDLQKLNDAVVQIDKIDFNEALQWNDNLDEKYRMMILAIDCTFDWGSFFDSNVNNLNKQASNIAHAVAHTSGGVELLTTKHLPTERSEQLNESIGIAKGVIRKDLLGRSGVFCNFKGSELWCQMQEATADIGWKLHVSDTPSSAAKIAAIILPYLNSCGVSYKVMLELHSMRYAYNLARYSELSSQRGKYIAIYPSSDEEAAIVARNIDNLLMTAIKSGVLSLVDFFSCVGDLKVGKSGGLFVRWCPSYKRDRDDNTRRLPIITNDPGNSSYNCFSDPNYKHPFTGLELTYCGVEMPDKVADWQSLGLFCNRNELAELAPELGRTISRNAQVKPLPEPQPKPQRLQPQPAKKVGKFDFSRKPNNP
jgi:hypothetical protein